MKALLIGYGEIGKAVHKVFSGQHDIEVYDSAFNVDTPTGEYDVLLVAIPYTPSFVEIVQGYKAKHIIVFSTVPIGTCSQIGACHCPVEGKHPYLAESMRKTTTKWLGGHDDICTEFVQSAGFYVQHLDKPEYTEFLKLRSTTLYGLNIEFARYSKSVCDDLGLDYEHVKSWDTWVDNLYHDLGMPWFRRYLLDPPKGTKGGHCVTPNALLLNEQYPDELVARVAELC